MNTKVGLQYCIGVQFGLCHWVQHCCFLPHPIPESCCQKYDAGCWLFTKWLCVGSMWAFCPKHLGS